VNDFLEFFIERLLWLWLPLYALYRITKDLIEQTEKNQKI